MPYIKQERREHLRDGYGIPQNAGELNYLFTKIIQDYLKSKSNWGYQDLNDVIGALEGCKLEFYRRHVVPYEEVKIKENGDVL